MDRLACVFASFLMLYLTSAPASAVTLDEGVVLFTQADATAGNVTPGDAPGLPITISVPGSYRLASNLSVPAGGTGIDVTAAEVTIDLSGFRMIGNNAATTGIHGRERALTVRNGTIRAFLFAVRLEGRTSLVENMRIADSTVGIRIETDGREDVVRSNTITGNSVGVNCGACLATGNVISHNQSTGITVTQGASVIGNTISFNGGNGIQGTTDSFGIGLNSIIDNSSSAVVGGSVPIDPNACAPQAC